MSDEQLTETINVSRRQVRKVGDLYFVVQWFETTGWIADGRGYPHSTSAYAKLGRINSREAQA